VQAVYPGFDSLWVDTAGKTAVDDGTATIEDSDAFQQKMDDAYENSKYFSKAHLIYDEDAHIFHFDKHLTSTKGLEPTNYTVSLRDDGKHDGAIAVEEGTENLIPNPTREVVSISNEFVKYVDLAPIFDKYGTEVKYSLSLDLKSADISNKDSIRVYMQSGSGTKYGFINKSVTVSEKYQRFYFDDLQPNLNESSSYTTAHLAFYGTYGTGNYPAIKNVQLEIKPYATSFTEGSRDRGILIYNYPEFPAKDKWTISFLYKQLSVHPTRYCSVICIGEEDDNYIWSYDTSENYKDGKWYHFVFKSDGSSVYRWVYDTENKNIVESGTATTLRTTSPFNGIITIGQQLDYSYEANALFDEMIFLPYEVDEATIQNWYEMDKPFVDLHPKTNTNTPTNVVLTEV
jgi:hypothetical protein